MSLELEMFSLSEIEKILGVTHRTLLTYVKQGRLKGVKIGRWYVSRKNLEAFLNGKTTAEVAAKKQTLNGEIITIEKPPKRPRGRPKKTE